MPYGKSPNKMGHKDSAMKMGHSPMKNQNKGYAKQERKDLMQDMPVDKRASAMQMGHESPAKMGHESPMKMAGSWMSKHSNSAFQMGHSPLEKKVKVNYKGKELTLDDRSPEYKHIMKAKEGNKQVATKAVMDKSGTSYTGFSKA